MLIRELRDDVYDILLQSHRPAPSSPESSGSRRYPSIDDESNWEKCNLYPDEDSKSATASLPLSCRQVHEEVRNAISRLQRLAELHYKLDCMLVNETKIHPTWLSFPAFHGEIPKLEVEFRLFGNVDGR